VIFSSLSKLASPARNTRKLSVNFNLIFSFNYLSSTMTSFNASTSVSEFLARLSATEQEFIAQGIDKTRAERLAEVVVRRSFEQEDN
jgi:hypothetical protein